MFWPWIAELILVTWRDIPGLGSIGGLKIKGTPHTVGGVLPAPGDYLATFVIMAPLAALADTRAKTPAILAGWAYVLMTLLTVLDPSDPLGKANTTSKGKPAVSTVGNATPTPGPQYPA